jgi:molybdopterin molybdotransferase
MISYEQALATVLTTVTALPPVKLPLAAAVGRVLAKPVPASWDMPHWDNSAMDGFACAAASLATGKSLPLVGAAYAGHPYNDQLPAGTAIRITTGAPLPSGADTVIPVEDTQESENQISIDRPVKQRQHVRYQGEEYRQGEVLLAAGALLHSGAVGLLAGAGVTQVEVYPQPKVAIFSTGDELVELGQQPGPGQIVNSNLLLLQARLRECGCIPLSLGIGEDRTDNLDEILERALAADLIISTGGVSVGEKDLVQQTLVERGFVRKFWQVAIKPGKPVLFGELGGKPCFGLPGNPAATAVTFELLVLPALRTLAGHPPQGPEGRTATLRSDVKAGGKRQLFLWCRCFWQNAGYQVEIPQRQGSGQMRSIAGNNALLAVPIGAQAIASGEQVEVILLGRG